MDEYTILIASVSSIFILLTIAGILALFGTIWYWLPLSMVLLISIIVACKWLACIAIPCIATYPVLLLFYGKYSQITIHYYLFASLFVFALIYIECKCEDKDN